MKVLEATVVMPVTCLIIISLKMLMVTFYDTFLLQTVQNQEKLAEIYESREVTYIRTYDRLENGFAQ